MATITPPVLCRWLVVGFHEPYYSSQGTYQLGTYFKEYLEALFYKYGVDIVITGHVHAYERSFPVYNGTVCLATSRFRRASDPVVGTSRSADEPPRPAMFRWFHPAASAVSPAPPSSICRHSRAHDMPCS